MITAHCATGRAAFNEIYLTVRNVDMTAVPRSNNDAVGMDCTEVVCIRINLTTQSHDAPWAPLRFTLNAFIITQIISHIFLGENLAQNPLILTNTKPHSNQSKLTLFGNQNTFIGNSQYFAHPLSISAAIEAIHSRLSPVFVVSRPDGP